MVATAIQSTHLNDWEMMIIFKPVYTHTKTNDHDRLSEMYAHSLALRGPNLVVFHMLQFTLTVCGSRSVDQP